MGIRMLGYAGAAGIATFLGIFVAVSELMAPFIEFSVLVGIPAGIVAGVLTAAVVVVQFGRGTDRAPRPLALTLGTFGLTFLAVFVVVLGGFRAGVTNSIASATILGLLSGLVVGARSRHELQPPG